MTWETAYHPISTLCNDRSGKSPACQWAPSSDLTSCRPARRAGGKKALTTPPPPPPSAGKSTRPRTALSPDLGVAKARFRPGHAVPAGRSAASCFFFSASCVAAVQSQGGKMRCFAQACFHRPCASDAHGDMRSPEMRSSDLRSLSKHTVCYCFIELPWRSCRLPTSAMLLCKRHGSSKSCLT